jgi:hypothetical protein
VNPAAESEALLLFFWFKPHPMREPLTTFPGWVVRGLGDFVGVGAFIRAASFPFQDRDTHEVHIEI